MSIEVKVAEHYDGTRLLSAIEAGLDAMGKTPETVGVDDLGPVDEFHIGGRPATTALCERMGIGADAEVLDIGCGIGGTARLLASTIGCTVTGLDLTPAYVDVARTLTRWTGLDDRIRYEVGSALDMPFDDDSFDAATQLHVGMNIEDKAALFAEANRVLRPGATFGVYDVLATGPGAPAFPVPWASDPSTSFLADEATYRSALDAAGFDVLEVCDRAAFALEFFAAMKARTAEAGGPPPIGLHVIIGNAAPEKLANMVDAIGTGIVAPVELICRARD